MRCAKVRQWVAGLTVLACAACGHPVAGAGSEAARSLTGAWEASFTADPDQIGTAGRRLPPVPVELVLMENGWLGSVAGLSGEPTHYGTFTADFRPLGFDPRAAGEVPSIAAAVVGRDSVELVLQPTASPTPLTAAGHVVGDSVVGRWWHSAGRGAGISGSFRMIRHGSARERAAAARSALPRQAPDGDRRW
jgi:hypothetical protein